MHFKPFSFPQKTFAAVAAAVLLAMTAGCTTADKTAEKETIAADAMKRPVDMTRICVLRSPQIQSEALVRALLDGVNRYNAEAVLLEQDAGPAACPMTVAYSVQVRDRSREKSITGVMIQTFRHGVPLLRTVGRAPEQSNGLTADNVAAFMNTTLVKSQAMLGDLAVTKKTAKQ